MSRLLNQLTQLFSVCTCSLLSQCFVTGVYLQMSDKWIDIGEGLTWQVFQQMWRVLSVAIFPLMMIFALLVQRKTWSQIYAIRFISVIQACSAITANFVLISWFSRSDEFMKEASSNDTFTWLLFTLICSSNVWSRCQWNQLKSKVKKIQMRQFFRRNSTWFFHQFRSF